MFKSPPAGRYVPMLAEAYGNQGHPKKGLSLLDEALGVVDETEIRKEEAELHRLKGELLLKHTLPDEQQA